MYTEEWRQEAAQILIKKQIAHQHLLKMDEYAKSLFSEYKKQAGQRVKVSSIRIEIIKCLHLEYNGLYCPMIGYYEWSPFDWSFENTDAIEFAEKLTAICQRDIEEAFIKYLNQEGVKY